MDLMIKDKEPPKVFRFRTPNGGIAVRCGRFTIVDELALQYPDSKDWTPVDESDMPRNSGNSSP